MKTHGPLQLDVFIEPMFQENAYLLWTADGPDAWIIDPGFPPQVAALTDAIRQHNLAPAAMVITHGHLDHIAGAAGLRDEFPDLRLLVPRDELHMLTDPAANLSAQLGLSVVAPEADQPLAPGDTLTLGPLTWRVLDVSGHSPGGLAYYCEQVGIVFSGDTLLAGGIGRTDFPGSSTNRLVSNIREQLLTLPDGTVVYSGHGPATTIARERDTNPFLREGLGW